MNVSNKELSTIALNAISTKLLGTYWDGISIGPHDDTLKYQYLETQGLSSPMEANPDKVPPLFEDIAAMKSIDEDAIEELSVKHNIAPKEEIEKGGKIKH